jgi:hypothetical protein
LGTEPASATAPFVVVTFTLLFGAAAAICVFTSLEILLSEFAAGASCAAGAGVAAGAGDWGASVLATGGGAGGAALAAVLLEVLLDVSELPDAGCFVLATEFVLLSELLSLERFAA